MSSQRATRRHHQNLTTLWQLNEIGKQPRTIHFNDQKIVVQMGEE